jgi:hypothetical protein
VKARVALVFPLALALALAATSCTAREPDPPTVGRTSEAIVRGTASPDAQDAVVLVVHYDPLQESGITQSSCTGTLLAPRLVLTARHCVSNTDDGALCDDTGKALQGGAVGSDYLASSIYVFGSKSRPDLIGGTARPSIGVEILTTGKNTLCNEDVALVLLDAPVVGATIAAIRLDGGPKTGEPVTAVGWGITETDPDPTTRQQRTGLSVVAVGPALDLGAAEFTVGEGTCSGDSGGPALSASGAVIGSLSRGGNGNQSPGASECIGSVNLYTSAAAHADFIKSGYAKAGQAPWLEGTPSPLLATIGGRCAADSDCQSSLCDISANFCTQECGTVPCPTGLSCLTRPSATPICVAATAGDASSGCDAAPVRRASFPDSLLAIAASACSLAVLLRRRRSGKTQSGRTCRRGSNRSPDSMIQV